MEQHLRSAPDAEPAAWVADGVWGFALGVLSILPAEFAAYARIFHPAERRGRHHRPGEMERDRGRERTPVSPLDAVDADHASRSTGERPGACLGPRAVRGAPSLGRGASSFGILAQQTTTPDRCWFAIWEGYGDLQAEVRAAPAFDFPGRRLHLFSGPIAALDVTFCDTRQQSANMCWPDDRAWFVATEIDFNTTHVGGSIDTIAAIPASSDLEALAVEPHDGVTVASDTLNPDAGT